MLEIALHNEGIDCGGVFLVDPETGALDLVAHRGFSADFAKRASHFAADPVGSPSGRRGRAIARRPAGPLAGIVRQLKRESLLALEVLPVQHSGEVVAVLNVGSRARREIPAEFVPGDGGDCGPSRGRHHPDPGGTIVAGQPELLEKTLHSLRSAVFVVNADTMVIEECNPAANPHVWLHPRRTDRADHRPLARE